MRGKSHPESPVLQQQCEAGAWQWQRSPYMCPQSLSSPVSTHDTVSTPQSRSANGDRCGPCCRRPGSVAA